MRCYCGSEACEIFVKNEDIRLQCYNDPSKNIIKCCKCGLIQLFPQWTNLELDQIYVNYNKKPDFEGQKETSKRLNKYLENYFRKTDKIAEIGCGMGDNVKHFRERGFNVVGVDKDPSVSVPGVVYCDDAINFLKQDSWDVIYAMHLLEHIGNPLQFLAELSDRIRPGGRIILELPNTEEPLLTLYGIREFFKFYWRPDHLFFYTPETLNNLLKGKYTIKRKQSYGVVNHINWLIRRKPTNLKMNLPIIDQLYKWVLCNIFRKSDTLFAIINF